MSSDILINGEGLSSEKFKNPSREFGIMPFWFWNGEMNYEEMEYQLKEYYAKGIPGIYIHARFGIKDNMGYLSEDWFDRVKFTVEKAREIGLQVWVYDEYNWPSGTADKQVMQEDPNLTERYLELIEMEIPGQFFTFLEGTDSRYIDMEQSEPVYACAILTEDLRNGKPNFINLMPSLSFDKVITWETPKGPWKLFYFIERKASWYIDTLNEDSTRKFLELTHERYKESMGGSFSGNIRGFYTDEPAMHYFEVGRDNYIIPWSAKMFKIFRDANGYDLKPHLPKLYFDLGGDTAKVRYDFWSSLTKQYEKAFYKQISDWCHENGVAFTGHLLFEEWIRMHARSGGNLFNYLKYLDVIGVDHIYPRIGNRDMPAEHVAIKIGSSAAHQFGSTRLLCESLGGAYWDVTMERMKWIADWEYVLGVNLFNPHGFHYSIEGERKRDWPPSQFYHHTWWKQYEAFNSYITRLSYLLSGGRHVAAIAVLYPINTIWANYTPQSRNAIGNVTEYDMDYMADTLLRLHFDFDFIDEDVLRDVEIRNGKLCIRDEEYSLLLLPPVTHIKESTLKLMEDFVSAGGSVVADTLLPCECVEGDGTDFIERVEALFGSNPLKVNNAFLDNSTSGLVLSGAAGKKAGRAVCMEGPGLHRSDSAEFLRSALLSCIQPEIEIDDSEVFYLHRIKDGKDFYFLVNPVEAGRIVTICIKGEGAPEYWNLETGDTVPVYIYEKLGDKICFKLEMQPYGSAMISFRIPGNVLHIEDTNLYIKEVEDSRITGYGRLAEDAFIKLSRQEGALMHLPAVKPLETIKPGDDWSFSINQPNVLLLDCWKVTVDEAGNGYLSDFFSTECNTDSWHDFSMGAWEMQLPFEREKATYPVTLWYRTEFEAGFLPGDAGLLIDGFKGSSYEIYINGRKVEEKPVRSFLDAEIKTVPICMYLKSGRNIIAIKLVVRGKSDGITDLLKITGRFILKNEADSVYSIQKPSEKVVTGSWVEQGYPFFSGTGEYTQKIWLDEACSGRLLKLKANCGSDILEVLVNGNYAGQCLWNPYELDITPFVKTGENLISLKVTNTLINILEGVKKPSGLFGLEIVPYDVYTFELEGDG